jgi:hypothetical protein
MLELRFVNSKEGICELYYYRMKHVPMHMHYTCIYNIYDEIISHFNEVLAPYVFDNQAFDENPSLGTPSSSQDC